MSPVRVGGDVRQFMRAALLSRDRSKTSAALHAFLFRLLKVSRSCNRRSPEPGLSGTATFIESQLSPNSKLRLSRDVGFQDGALQFWSCFRPSLSLMSGAIAQRALVSLWYYPVRRWGAEWKYTRTRTPIWGSCPGGHRDEHTLLGIRSSSRMIQGVLSEVEGWFEEEEYR